MLQVQTPGKEKDSERGSKTSVHKGAHATLRGEWMHEEGLRHREVGIAASPEETQLWEWKYQVFGAITLSPMDFGHYPLSAAASVCV